MIDDSVFLKPGDMLNGLRLEGFSRAGVGTSLWLPHLGVCFDVGPGVHEQAVCSKFFITHAHLDHSSGIPYILSQRTLQGLFDNKIYAMEPLINCYRTILDAWKLAEDFDYQVELHVFESGTIKIQPGFEVIPFKTVHRIPSQGYTLRQRKKKLKPELDKKSEEELREMRGKGIEITHELVTPLLSFTGDTMVDVFQVSPEILESKLLFIEASYYDEKKSIEDARKWGHLHLDELAPWWQRMKCDYLVLKHTSRRHSRKDVLEALNRCVPAAWASKVRVWGM
ncbi:MAG: hypothetical protein K2X47_07385 [Bdellovibrionales bacterium]|nr:hypothetical protein [Bdellovibrionales bacterium]